MLRTRWGAERRSGALERTPQRVHAYCVSAAELIDKLPPLLSCAADSVLSSDVRTMCFEELTLIKQTNQSVASNHC